MVIFCCCLFVFGEFWVGPAGGRGVGWGWGEQQLNKMHKTDKHLSCGFQFCSAISSTDILTEFVQRSNPCDSCDFRLITFNTGQGMKTQIIKEQSVDLYIEIALEGRTQLF